MTISWRAASAVLDLGTAVCAAVNWLYFSHRLFAGVPRPPGRQAALLTLALLSLGTLVEALALLAIGVAGGHGESLASPAWAAVRAFPFAATAAISALIARRAAGR